MRCARTTLRDSAAESRFRKERAAHRADRDVISARFNNPRSLAFLLIQDVAKYAPLFADKIFTARPQVIKHAPGNEGSRRQLRGGMAEFLPGTGAEILEQAHVLDPRVALEIQNALGGKPPGSARFLRRWRAKDAGRARDSPPVLHAPPPNSCDRKCRRRGGRARLQCDTAAWDEPSPVRTSRPNLASTRPPGLRRAHPGRSGKRSLEPGQLLPARLQS